MRSLGIDYGTRRVGLALSDAGGTLASPAAVLEVSTPAHAALQVAQVARREGAERLVVGLPLNMDGTFGSQAKLTAAWAADLGRELGVPVVFVDERLTSYDAEQSLIERKRGGEKLTRKRKKGMLDALAAALILQRFLDGELDAIEPETLPK